MSQNISRSRYGGVTAARPRIADGCENGKDDLVDRADQCKPSHGHSPQTGPDQLSVGTTASSADDSPLLALERQFNTISGELLAVQQLRRNQNRSHSPAAHSPEQATIEPGVEHTFDELATRRIESILVRLDPIERAIMETSVHACWIGRESTPRSQCAVPVLGNAYRPNRLGCKGCTSPDRSGLRRRPHTIAPSQLERRRLVAPCMSNGLWKRRKRSEANEHHINHGRDPRR